MPHWLIYITCKLCSYSILIFCLIQCNRTVSLRALHAQLFNPPTKIASMGSGCSIATEASAEVSHFYNITQVGDNNYAWISDHACLLITYQVLHWWLRGTISPKQLSLFRYVHIHYYFYIIGICCVLYYTAVMCFIISCSGQSSSVP